MADWFGMIKDMGGSMGSKDKKKPDDRPVDIFADGEGSTANRLRERRRKQAEEAKKLIK